MYLYLPKDYVKFLGVTEVAKTLLVFKLNEALSSGGKGTTKFINL